MKTFYNLIFLFVLLALPNLGNAQTEVAGGTLTGTTTWELTGSPYNINGDIVVPDGSSLIIEPGVQVTVQEGYNISIEGQLKAIGSADKRIVFTSSSNWQGLKITRSPGNDSTLFKYVTIEESNLSGISISNSDSISIENCEISNTSSANGGGINISNSTVSIINCYFKSCEVSDNGNGGAIYASESNINIINNIFYVCGGSLTANGGSCAFYSSSVKLINNTFAVNSAKTYGGAVFINEGSLDSYNNIYHNNFTRSYSGVNLYYNSATGFHSYDAFSVMTGLPFTLTSISSSSSTITYQGGSYGATNTTMSYENDAENGPNFKLVSEDLFSLTIFSTLLINRGDTAGISQYLPEYDYAGEQRILHDKIDRGAYELNYSTVISTVTSVVQGNGSISPEGDSTISYLDAIEYTITPNAGEELVSVQYSGTDITAELTDKGTYYTYTLDSVVENSTITATFTQPFTVTASATGSGTISPQGEIIVDYGESQEFQFTPDEGYIISKVVLDGTPVLFPNNSYTLSDVKADHTLHVEFEKFDGILSFYPERDAHIYYNSSNSDRASTNYGLSETIIIKCESTYKNYWKTLIHFSGMQDIFSSLNLNNLEDTIESVNLNLFTQSLSGDNAFNVYNYNEDWEETGVTWNNAPALDNDTSYVQVPASTSSTQDYSIDITDIFLSQYNESDGSAGFWLDFVENTGTKYVVLASKEYDDYNAWPRIVIRLKGTYYVSASATEGGTLTPTGDSIVHTDDEIIYTITPNEGYGVASANYNGASILDDLVYNGSNYTYSLTNITEDGNLEVSFENLYTITASASEGGSIAPEGDSTVFKGSSIVYTITPNSGKQLSTAQYNGTSIMNDLVNNGSDYTYTLSNITGDGNLEVSFANLYTVTASALEGGSIAPEGDSTVVEGSSITYTITPNSGNQVATAQYNGESVINNLVNQDSYYLYEVSNITENGTLQITFSDIPDGINNVTKEKLNIAPNPTTGIVNIPLLSGVSSAELLIYNITGTLVYSNAKFNGEDIDLSQLKEGMYIVKMKSGQNISLGKLTKK